MSLAFFERNAHKIKKGASGLDCWFWLGYKTEKGYGYAYDPKRKRSHIAHRLAYESYHQILLKSHTVVMHICDNPACVNPVHLKSGTQKDNMKDCKNKKRNTYGARHPMAKMSFEKSVLLKKLYATGIVSQRELGDLFGISQTVAYNIISGKFWMDCPEKEIKKPCEHPKEKVKYGKNPSIVMSDVGYFCECGAKVVPSGFVAV